MFCFKCPTIPFTICLTFSEVELPDNQFKNIDTLALILKFWFKISVVYTKHTGSYPLYNSIYNKWELYSTVYKESNLTQKLQTLKRNPSLTGNDFRNNSFSYCFHLTQLTLLGLHTINYNHVKFKDSHCKVSHMKCYIYKM